jgi:hypothetical protein
MKEKKYLLAWANMGWEKMKGEGFERVKPQKEAILVRSW